MAQSLSIALTGAGGAGVMTAGEMLLKLAAKAGYYGLMVRSSGPQIRGGEAAAFLRLSTHQVVSQGDVVDVLFAFDWNNVERFAAEIPLTENSLVMCDVKAGDPPAMVTDPGAKVIAVPLTETVKGIEGGRINMVGVGLIGGLLGLPEPVARQLIADTLGKKGDAAVEASIAGYVAGEKLAADAAASLVLNDAEPTGVPRWNISGNEATGLGAIKAGVRFVAAYPITPATEVLEWLAPNLERLGGTLVQAEDELASVNMILGGSFGGVPALTATAGPGLSLMTEAIGLAVASETPIVVVDVMRGGPSTGIPTKSEQTDLNIALYGLHGDAPHVVTAANSIPDCQFTAQWTVHLAEALQTAAILLTDQSLGQARAVVDKPADIAFVGKRETWNGETETYLRYANTASGVSPMAIPGTADGEYVADGLEHMENGRPSSGAEDHYTQLEKRARKLETYEFGDHWAEIEGSGDTAIVTWGSITAVVREARDRLKEKTGKDIKVISLRLLMPAQTEKFAAALEGVDTVLVIEQSHSKQFYRYLRAFFDLPRSVRVINKPGPLPFRPGELLTEIEA